MDDDDPLFIGVSVTILPSEHLCQPEIAELGSNLRKQGATVIPLLADGQIDDVAQLSHIISTHVDFPDYAQALENNCHVVRPSWVQQSMLKHRQATARQHSPDPALIFKEIVVTCAELPEGDKEAIIAGVIALGGMHSAPLTKLVTHIVSLAEEHPKVQAARSHRLDCKTVLPHWFDDCLKLGKKISERPYLLPDPELLTNNLPPRPTHQYQLSDLEGATSAVAGQPPQLTPPPSSPATPSSTRKKLNVFSGRSVYFSRDLNINDRLARTLTSLVTNGGGTVTQSIKECHVYIGMYRDGLDYVTASRASKDVANLSWFYNVVARNRWSNPISKLLHYPIPRNGIPGFEKFRISLSNYSGESRLYLENLASVAGAEFTKTMKQDNTHLITAHRMSEKCDAAEEWNINIINHLWLEESYARCEPQALTHARYTFFPTKTNLGEVVGQTSIDMASVRQTYFPADPSTNVDRDDSDSDGPQEIARTFISHGAMKPAISHGNARSRAKADHEDGTASSSSQTSEDSPVPGPPKGRSKAAVEHAADMTPAALSRSVLNARHNDTPSTGRSSKQKAMAKIHDNADDMALYEKEKKRKGGVIHGRKRGRGDAEDGVLADRDVDVKAKERASKRAKSSETDLPPVRYKMLVSGDERWLEKSKKEAQDKKTLRSLGIQLVSTPSDCTLLCAPRILRTKKFLVALANAPEVVQIGYLDYALRHNALHDTSHFALVDRESEQKLKINLSDSLERARLNNHRLLRGWTIYVSASIEPNLETFGDIIEINGGTKVPYRGRTGVHLPHRRLTINQDPEAGAESQHQGGDVECDYVYLVSSTRDDEVKTWSTFRQMATKQGLKARVVKTDWLLNLAMAQRIEWNDSWELHESAVPGWTG